MDDRELQPRVLYALSHEYSDQAHKMASCVSTEEELRQYYALISLSIKALQGIKEQFQLTTEQDVKITLELCELLLEETHNMDLAEMYLSSLRERLLETTLFNEKMHVEYALIMVAKARGTPRYAKEALRNLNRLLEMLQTMDSPWYIVFLFIQIQLSEHNEKPDRVIAYYHRIIEISMPYDAFHILLLCNYVCYCLDHCLALRNDLLEELIEKKVVDLPAGLLLWQQFVELLILIYRDENVTSKLSDFKELLSVHKQEFLAASFNLEVSSDIVLTMKSPILRYPDIKNILLLLQSVSFLTNCYDKRTNFSTKFIPKVRKATEHLMQAPQISSLAAIEENQSFYRNILELCNFYSCLEGIILRAEFSELPIPEKYYTFVEGEKSQIALDSNGALARYSKIAKSKDNPELQLIALCNMFDIYLSKMSKAGNTVALDQYKMVNETWDQIQSVYEEHGFHQNHVWRCTLAILWITSHFEPFTNVQLAQKGNEPYLDQLKWYYMGNRLNFSETNADKRDDEISEQTEKSPPLKKSLLLHILLNYLAGSIVVHDLQEKCQVSNACFHMGKQQEMPLMRYTAGIWNLINCSLAMKGKDVAVAKVKLGTLVQKLLESGFTEL